MDKINNNLINFINATPNAYSCVENLKKLLLDNEYVELYDNDNWSDIKDDGKYFISKGDSSLIAFQMTGKTDQVGFNITASHTDSPSFSIKNNAEIFDEGYLKLNISGYGSMINHTWLDRPLSFSGRVIYLDKGIYKKQIINIDKDLLIIPSQAIHIDRDVNEKNNLNHQIDMLPIMSLDNNFKLNDIIKNELEKANLSFDKVCDYDLYLYNRDQAKICGLNNEFILAPRLDDLACVYSSISSFVESENTNSINVFSAFNNEEIGSLSQQGADSTFLLNTLTRIAKSADIDLLTALNNTFVISADNAHALHPNASYKSDPTNKVYLNKGIVIKHHPNYTTDGLSSSLFKGICDNSKIPYQDFACRSDMRCGATLGNISTSHVGIDSVDIGLPQLAMHSANETIGSKDTKYMYDALLEFYQTAFRKEKGMIKILKK